MFEVFLVAQARVYNSVVSELAAGQKRSHWMWFIFPQLMGLGQSETAQRFGIPDLAAAKDYLADETLGGRLIECTELVLDIEGRTLRDIFGSPDDIKFRSSMTLFSRAAEGTNGAVFREALDKYSGGQEDPRTLDLLGEA